MQKEGRVTPFNETEISELLVEPISDRKATRGAKRLKLDEEGKDEDEGQVEMWPPGGRFSQGDGLGI
jgi:hypothetical protein